MNRRTFIRISGWGTAIALAPVMGSCNESKWRGTLAIPQIPGKFCNREELIEIGAQYCLTFPEEADESALEAMLLGNYQPRSNQDLVQFINQKILQEFADNELVIVRGWVLAETEARQIALYSLINA